MLDFAKTSRRTLLICVLLSFVTLLVFWPQTRHEFITYDDPFYIVDNVHVQHGLSWQNLAWAFQSREAGNWHPVTWLSHMLDVQLFGLKAGWHHLVSLLFHTANTVLLFLLLQRMTGNAGTGAGRFGVHPLGCSEAARTLKGKLQTGRTSAAWRSAFVAALFALHPLHVQSVAWAAERKDVLSAFFFMLTLLAYARYAGKSVESRVQSLESAGHGSQAPGNATRTTHHASRFTPHASRLTPHPLFWYLLSLGFFALGLMCKPMLVTVPFLLLLLDYWPLRRLRLRTQDSGLKTCGPLLLEKLPFFALSAACCAVTLWAQRGGGAVVPTAVLTLPQRLANAVTAYAGYLEKTVWPANLSVLYPLSGDVQLGSLLLSVAVLAAITVWALWSWRTRPHLAVGWFWYLGMLVPVIGLVQVGLQRMADRYTYLPLIGVFVMVAWGTQTRNPKPETRPGEGESEDRKPENNKGTKEQRGERCLRPLLLRAFVVPRIRASGFGLLSDFGLRTSDFAWVGAASLILLICAARTSTELGYWQDSEHLFAHALAVTPANYIALDNYGRALLKQKRLPEAAQAFAAAVALHPDLDSSRCGLGEVLQEQGKYEEAADQFVAVLKVQPDDFLALIQLGSLRGRQGKLDEAADLLSRALRLRPDDPGVHNNLGSVLLLQGKYADAAQHFQETLRLKPDHTAALNNLAVTCKKLGRPGEAIAHFRQVLRLQPDSFEALNNLAWVLAACPDARYRSGSEALSLATQACELTKYRNPTALATLAAAYAEIGQFPQAISAAEQAQETAKAAQPALSARLTPMLEAFRAGRAYHAD